MAGTRKSKEPSTKAKRDSGRRAKGASSRASASNGEPNDQSCNDPHTNTPSPIDGLHVDNNIYSYYAETMVPALNSSPQEGSPRQFEFRTQVDPGDEYNTYQQPFLNTHNADNGYTPYYETESARDQSYEGARAGWDGRARSESAVAGDYESSGTGYEEAPQLQAWVYETANSELTVGERLQKSQWERDLEK